jgi:hypothetical protein
MTPLWTLRMMGDREIMYSLKYSLRHQDPIYGRAKSYDKQRTSSAYRTQ